MNADIQAPDVSKSPATMTLIIENVAELVFLTSE